MACPAPPHSRKGNRVTAVRWARILRSLGHQLTIGQEYDGTPCDLCIALHARRSYQAVALSGRTVGCGPDRDRPLSRYPHQQAGTAIP